MSINIRTAGSKDIPQIVELLKDALGESLMPKSEVYWIWKHVNNPFGPSPVLIAEEEGKLIGVRAFMRWEWIDNDKKYTSLRAVDTATRPSHQGKGVFKKLTLQLVNEALKMNNHFIFNTPNDKSKSGYLKMGWEEVGRLPIYIRPVVRWRNWQKITSLPEIGSAHSITKFLKQEFNFNNEDKLKTIHSLEYFKWRYLEVPVVNYGGILLDVGGLIFRLKKTKNRLELRIVEAIKLNPSEVNKLVNKLIKDYNPAFVTFTGLSFKPGILWIKLNKGPLVTKKMLAISKEEYMKLNFTNWKPSLGDLELF